MGDGKIVAGGKTDAAQRYIAPTIVEGVSWDHAIMQEEIFGPILPVLDFDDLETVMTALEVKPKPLALYFFSENRDRQEQVLRRLSSGGACINDTFAQLLNLRLPFGGVGDSGMGSYHGKAGFDTFSHSKSVVKRSTWSDPGIKYPPYTDAIGGPAQGDAADFIVEALAAAQKRTFRRERQTMSAARALRTSVGCRNKPQVPASTVARRSLSRSWRCRLSISQNPCSPSRQQSLERTPLLGWSATSKPRVRSTSTEDLRRMIACIRCHGSDRPAARGFLRSARLDSSRLRAP